MKTVTLQSSKAQATNNGSYRLDLAVTSSNDISSYVFVKQRIKLPDNTNDDRFVCVASPVQLEEIPQQDPGDGNYYRDNSISLVSSDPNFIATTRDTILSDIQLTIIQSEQLDVLSVDVNYTVSSAEIVAN